jgi:hypothetical protein
MIFARRAIQNQLDELRPILGEAATSALAARLNRAGKDRLAATWEVGVLGALSKLGELGNEIPLESGSRPDVAFNGHGLAFVADVTTVSDAGVDEKNPFQELSVLIEDTKTRLGLKAGGLELRIGSKTEQTMRGSKIALRLPDRNRLREFVRKEIEPKLRDQIKAGSAILSLVIDDETTGIHVVIDPSKSPYSSVSYAAYDIPTIKDRNPLYNALHAKAKQLRGATGLAGVIVGDGDSRTLEERQQSWYDVSAREIAEEFLRQNSSIHFVLLVSAREDRSGWRQPLQPPNRSLNAQLVVSKTMAVPQALEDVFRQMLAAMPMPVATPVNAANRSREEGYGLGFHGGHELSNRRVKISVREMMELFAGRRTAQELNASHRWSSPTSETSPSNGQHPVERYLQESTTLNPFERYLQEGRLPASIAIIRTGENDSDHWVEIEFGDPDPAISPFF